MKNVLMILVVFAGFAVSASAQAKCEPANCAPCPPGCFIINCWPKGAAANSQEKHGDALFASMLNVDQKASASTCTMSKKEMKACLKACKAQSASAVTVDFHPATSGHVETATTGVQPAPQKAGLQKS